jgi:hypothetical protein
VHFTAAAQVDGAEYFFRVLPIGEAGSIRPIRRFRADARREASSDLVHGCGFSATRISVEFEFNLSGSGA